jgi:hypothetical protein
MSGQMEKSKAMEDKMADPKIALRERDPEIGQISG